MEFLEDITGLAFWIGIIGFFIIRYKNKKYGISNYKKKRNIFLLIAILPITLLAIFSKATGLLLIISFVGLVTYLVKYLSHKDKRQLYKGPLIIFSVLTVILFVYGAFTSDLNPNSEVSKEEKQEQKLNKKKKEKEAEINHQKEIHEKQEQKKESEDKKEKQQTNDLKKKNEQKNLQSYKEELNKIPEKTNNLITKAYIDDSGSEQTTIVLNDEAINVSDSELQNVSHSAYNSVQNIIDNYKPFPDDSLAYKIRITDSSGNLIAKSSFSDEFKFINK